MGADSGSGIVTGFFIGAIVATLAAVILNELRGGSLVVAKGEYLRCLVDGDSGGTNETFCKKKYLLQGEKIP